MNDIRVTEHLWVPLPDGRRLAAKLWLPADPGPAPAILEYLPYRKRDGTAPRDATTHPVFAAHGYACIRVDIAGTGESDGLFDDEYSEQELSDGEAVIAWIAAQEWCDGNLGMIGISWGGFNGLQLAFRRPEPLKAIVTCCSTVDRWQDDIHYMAGSLLTDNFNWGCQMTAYQTRPPDPALREDWREEWVKRIEALPFAAADWQARPTREGFWQHGSVCEDWDAIEAATLAIGGWADAYVNAPSALAANLTAPVAALIGPWEHKYPHIARVNPADFHGEVIRWFGHWLKGEATGAEDLPAYRAFIQEHDNPSAQYGPRKGRWVAETDWPSPYVTERVLHLTPDGLAETQGQGACPVNTDLAVGQASSVFCAGMRVENELAGDQAPDDALSVCFDTAELAKPLELLGRPVLEVAFTVDKPLAQLCARLCDVAPDGVSQRVSYRVFNLAHAGESPGPLEPGRTYTMRLELNECGHRLRTGHRLRLALSTSYWPVVWPSPEAATVTLDLAKCRLLLPERRVSAEIDPIAPGEPIDFPRIAAEALRESESETTRETWSDGALHLGYFDDFGTDRHSDHGLTVGSSVSSDFVIHPEDPTTAEHRSSWVFEFARDNWSARIESGATMTCDAVQFYLERHVIARADGQIVCEKRWRETLPRALF